MAGVVGAGGGAIAGTPATGVDHGVEPFICMHGGMHGTDSLAGGLLALPAGSGEVESAVLRCGVAVNTQPLQVTVVGQIGGSNGGDVVFCAAGQSAGTAAVTAIEGDDERPLRGSSCRVLRWRAGAVGGK